jgi:hypothetical protein
MEIGKNINEATKKMDNEIEENVEKKVDATELRIMRKISREEGYHLREERKCSRLDSFMFCTFTAIVAAHIGAYFFGPTNLLRPICATFLSAIAGVFADDVAGILPSQSLGGGAIFIEILGLSIPNQFKN